MELIILVRAARIAQITIMSTIRIRIIANFAMRTITVQAAPTARMESMNMAAAVTNAPFVVPHISGKGVPIALLALMSADDS